MSDCVFCMIFRGEAESSVAYEDDVLAVVMDLHPVNTGHALVVPRTHAPYLADLDEDTAAALFATALRAAAALRSSSIRCEGVNVLVADGEAAGQEVFHVHVHVIPRFAGDPFRIEHAGGWTASPRAELEAAAVELRSVWSSSS